MPWSPSHDHACDLAECSQASCLKESDGSHTDYDIGMLIGTGMICVNERNLENVRASVKHRIWEHNNKLSGQISKKQSCEITRHHAQYKK